MMADERQHGIEKIDAFQHVDPDDWMLLHSHRFFGLEPRLLAEDRILDADLADVVQHAGAPAGTDLPPGRAEGGGPDDGVLLDPSRMPMRVGIAGLDRRR